MMLVKKKKINISKIFQGFIFDDAEILSWVAKNRIKILGIQLPEGLKLKALKFVKTLEDLTGVSVILLADPCFGACDLPFNRFNQVTIDGIIHFGHAKIPNAPMGKIPIKFVELTSTLDPTITIRKKNILKKIKAKFKPPQTLGLLTNIQYIPYLEEVKKILEKEKYEIMIPVGGKRLSYSGQVLGCNFSNARAIQNQVLGFIFIGEGQFHPIGLAMATAKPVLVVNPVNKSVDDIEPLKNRILRQRSGAIATAMKCETFGILLSTKPAQTRKQQAINIKHLLENSGKSAVIIVQDLITPAVLDYLPFDAYVNTACPRLAIDDYLQYKKPIITPIELEILLGIREWENYLFDEIE